MIADEELFFARRLGYGLRQGETVGPDVRAWAVGQIKDIPPLDFYGPDGRNLRDHFPDFAEPTLTFREACRLWGVAENKENELFQKVDKMPEDEWRHEMEQEVWLPRSDYPYWRDCLVRSLTAVHGPSPVFERFWTFWVNHFTVSATAFTKLFYGPHTRAIRDRMTGNVEDMLRGAVLNPAMLFYLDNFLSSGPHSEIALHTSETINENLARELLELHTMSPEAGYTQDDVIQTAYALTGWGFFGGAHDQPEIPGNPYGTYFEVKRHEPGKRTIMGKTYSDRNRGMNQAGELIRDLAMDERTARFVSWKLIRHFLADEPPEDSVNKVRDAWMDSGGDLVTIHTAVIDEVLAHAPDHPKFTTPENWLYQVHRTTGVKVPESRPWAGSYWINALCDELGQSYNECAQPNGWSDLKADWTSKELLERRVRYAFKIGSQMFDESRQAFILETAGRLSGPDSDLVKAMKAADNRTDATVILLASPDFMRI